MSKMKSTVTQVAIIRKAPIQAQMKQLLQQVRYCDEIILICSFHTCTHAMMCYWFIKHSRSKDNEFFIQRNGIEQQGR